MKSIVLPDYKGGSILNLTSTIAEAAGGKPVYPLLRNFSPLKLSSARNLVLLIIDGLGYEWFCKHAKDSFLSKFLRRSLTSVFPSDTAANITSFHTGFAPSEHGTTGWYLYMKELGTVAEILPFAPRYGGTSFSRFHVRPHDIFTSTSIFESTERICWLITQKKIVDSDYTLIMTQRTRKLPYRTIGGFFQSLKLAIRSSRRKKYIVGYWAKFDSLSHRHGTNHRKTIAHFQKLESRLAAFLKTIAGTETTILITADHGFMNQTTVIELDRHPELKATLTLPLSGNSRTAYCYVRPFRVPAFRRYIRTHLSDFCDLVPSETLIRKQYFGFLNHLHPALADRVGDFTLLMKNGAVIRDRVLAEEKQDFIGHHGGLSPEEMLVPLILIPA